VYRKQRFGKLFQEMKKPGRKSTRDGICSKCRERPVVIGQAWCSRCAYEYKKDHRETELERRETQGFSKGVDAMAQSLADEFERYDRNTGGGAMVEIERVVSIIRAAPRPVLVRQPVNGS
jgi:hypothetical protein